MKAEKKLSPKVKALYEAVEELIFENIDVKEIKVSDITERAGIGKGTAYEYFRNKEEIISSAMLYHIDLICRQMIEKLEEFYAAWMRKSKKGIALSSSSIFCLTMG